MENWSNNMRQWLEWKYYFSSDWTIFPCFVEITPCPVINYINVCCSWLPILLMFIQLFLGNFLVCEPCPLHDFVGDFNGLSILCLGKLLLKPWWPKQWSRNLKSPPKNTLNLYPHNKNSLLWNLSISMKNFSKTKVTIRTFIHSINMNIIKHLYYWWLQNKFHELPSFVAKEQKP